MALLDLLKARYPLKALSGGYNNAVFAAEIDGEPRVIKIVENECEASALALLGGDCAPKLYGILRLDGKGALVESRAPMPLDSPRFEGERALIMSRAPGRNIQSLLDAGDVDLVARLCAKMGELLARDVHSIAPAKRDIPPVRADAPDAHGDTAIIKPPLQSPDASARDIRGDMALASAPHNVDMSDMSARNGGIPRARVLPPPDFVPRALARELERRLEDLPRENFRLTHGDFGAHNALYAPDGRITLLDWEWAEFAAPERDIAWLSWFFKLHYPEIADKLFGEFISGYSAPYDRALFAPWAVYQVVKILRIAAETDAETQSEWLRRAEWTLSFIK